MVPWRVDHRRWFPSENSIRIFNNLYLRVLVGKTVMYVDKSGESSKFFSRAMERERGMITRPVLRSSWLGLHRICRRSVLQKMSAAAEGLIGEKYWLTGSASTVR